MSNDLIIRNCRLYSAPEDARLVELRIAAGRIASIGGADSREGSGHAPLQALDAGGRTVTPGFIDAHVHGAAGADVLDGTEAALRTVAEGLARVGTTAFLATTFLDPSTGHRHLPTIADFVGRDLGGAQLLGVHLEGPFISAERRGGLPAAAIVPPSRDALETVLDLTHGALRMMTIAPELRGNLDIIGALVERGIIASLGHSAASYEEAKAGFAAGIRHVTHLYNAMPSLHHREPGPLPAIFEEERVTADIVCDGAHVHPAVVRWTYRLLGGERLICISDGVRAVGLPDGRYLYGGREFEAAGGTARYLDGTLIGTATGAGRLALRFRDCTDCPLATAIHAATRNPARLLGIADRKGSIAVGMDADLAILDANGSVWATVVAGRLVHQKER